MNGVFNVIALLLGLSAFFGWLNHRWLRLPHTIGLLVLALASSLALVGLDAVIPGLGVEETARRMVADFPFRAALMEGALSFLLFAGALHVDLDDLLERKWTVALMATGGVALSTVLVGGGLWWIFSLLGVGVPLLVCLVLGSVISPTDPVAVMGILGRLDVSDSLRAKIAGESLFNDGVGVVFYTILVSIAFGHGHASGGADALEVARLFLQEAGGGILLGLVMGAVVFYAMRSIDKHDVEILLTLALVSVTYAVAGRVHVSGPIAVVVAGLLVGNQGTRLAMSSKTRHRLLDFWELLDEILNSLLFLLIGFEVLTVSTNLRYLEAALAAIPLALLARLAAVTLPLMLLRRWRGYEPGTIEVLTWGGLRGGISVAMALGLPESPWRSALLTACYAVVVFSVVVQGLTIERLVQKVATAR